MKEAQTYPWYIKIHQLKTKKNGKIWYRDTSCTCDEGRLHSGHKWKFSKIIKGEIRPDPFVHIASISINSKAINESDDELNVAAEEYDLDTSEHRKTSLLQINYTDKD